MSRVVRSIETDDSVFLKPIFFCEWKNAADLNKHFGRIKKAHNGCVSSTICSPEVLSGLISVVSTVASASYNYILLPVAGAAASAGKAIYTYVLVPCGTATMACGRFLVQARQESDTTCQFLHDLDSRFWYSKVLVGDFCQQH